MFAANRRAGDTFTAYEAEQDHYGFPTISSGTAGNTPNATCRLGALGFAFGPCAGRSTDASMMALPRQPGLRLAASARSTTSTPSPLTTKFWIDKPSGGSLNAKRTILIIGPCGPMKCTAVVPPEINLISCCPTRSLNGSGPRPRPTISTSHSSAGTRWRLKRPASDHPPGRPGGERPYRRSWPDPPNEAPPGQAPVAAALSVSTARFAVRWQSRRR